MSEAIVIESLRKRYGDTAALDGLDLTVPEGTVVGLLGPNGAGKTTAVRILSTLVKPDGGSAKVFGADVVENAPRVRASIGLTGQFSAVDDILTGAENLRMIGRLFRLGKAEARDRADALLAAFDLADAGDRQVKTYSGGMSRRLDLAASLMARPRILVLDEPTTGLDPRSRLALWDVIGRLREAGTTVLLTTQYLEEADLLADSIAVMERGKLLASGTADELKAQVGGEHLVVKLNDGHELAAVAEALGRYGTGDPSIDRATSTVTVGVSGNGLDDLPEILLELRQKKVRVADVAVRRPTLDEVFLTLTGKPAENRDDAPPQSGAAAKDEGATDMHRAGDPTVHAGAGSREG